VPIRTILLLLSLVSFLGGPIQALLPVFARDILSGGAQTLGFLVAASGLGALCGAIFLASRKNVLGLGRLIAFSSGLFSFGIMSFSQSRAAWLSAALIFLAGFGMMVQMAASNTVLQMIVEEDKRGRIMSLYTMSLMGMSPLGSLLAGFLAAKLGAPATLFLGGICCLGGALFFARQLPVLRKYIRPIYLKNGLITEIG
jgi:MFS family permease